MSRLVDLSGMKFGMLTVIGKSESARQHTKWICKCECGNETIAHGSNLKRGTTKSCGCYKREFGLKKFTEHGESIRKENGKIIRKASPEYTAWIGMKARCYDKNNKRFKDYGGRGIEVCEVWRNDFSAFLNDMLRRPAPRHSLERLDSNKNYSPENCVWATALEQNRNKVTRNKFGYAGIAERSSGKYSATIWVEYKSIYLGTFDDIDKAIRARKDAETEYWGRESS